MSGEETREAEERDVRSQEDTFKALSDAYAFVRGQEQIRALERTSFGDLFRARVVDIEGPSTGGIPSRLEELDSVKGKFDAAVERLRAREEENENADE